MSIAELSIRRPITTVMCFVTLVVVGLLAAVRLPLEAFPSVSFPVIFMQMPYQGSTPEEVERTLVRPSEEALATLPGIRNIQSTATATGANIMVLFSDWERDVKIAASEARERIDAIRNDLPDELTRIFVGNASTDDQPVLAIRLASQTLDLSKSYDLIDRELKRRIERVPGVAQVRVSGATANEVEVAIDPQRLSAHGLSLDDLNKRLRDLNFSVSAGQVTDGGQRLRVQPVGELESLDQLRGLVLSGNVRLGDVADVRLKPARNEMGRRLDGRPAVGLDVFKERSANLVEVSRQVLAEVERIQSEPAMRGIQVKTINDQGAVVTDSLLELAEAGAIGLILSVIVLYFFLRHWPSTLMVSLAIPICFIMTLGFMYFAGVTLNILSMMGLLLAVGMLVDNAVVVVESIYQEREKNPGNPRLASIIGTRHVAIALSAGTLCHCIVFVPNLFGERNVLAIYLSQIAITISVSLLASWLVAVSLIPMLSARLKTPPALTSRTGVIHRLQERYAHLLHWSLVNRGKSLLGILLMVAISLAPVMLTKYNMFGGDEEAETEIGYQWNGSYTVEQMSTEVARVEDFLDARRKDYHITQIYSWFSEQGWGGTRVTFDENYKGELKPLVDRLSRDLPKSARARLIVGPQGDGGGGGGPPKSVQFRLVGDSTQVLNDIARDILPVLERRPELRDVRVDTGDRNQEVQVRIDRERAASFGFTTEQVGTFVGMALRGARLRDFRQGDTEVPVWVRFAGAEQYGAKELSSFTVRAADGRQVPLLAMVDVVPGEAASQIRRINRQTTLTIEAAPDGKTTMPEARKAVEETLKSITFPAGYSHTFETLQFFDESQMVKQMIFNLLIALVMVYVVMAAVFESLLFPSAIMSGVVFSVFGVFWLFWLTGTEFNIMAFIGILVLMGVVVNNGIVMVEHINNLRRRGLSRTEALVEGSRERLRPVLMTMGTAILAMIPIAMSQGTGDGIAYAPMARAIAGGLAFSTVATLLFLPTVYAILDDMGHGAGGMVRRARRRKIESPLGGTVSALTAE